MTDRPPPSTLKGRLADVFLPALVSGGVEALSRRLGNRATLDDPQYGRASSLASLDPLISKFSTWLTQSSATYRHVASTTGIDRDVSEGVLMLGDREMPIAIVAERRRLREIELRLYYWTGSTHRVGRPPLVTWRSNLVVPPLALGLVDALRVGAVEHALASFEEAGVLVDARGEKHQRHTGALAQYLQGLGPVEISVGGGADDGRTCCVEGALSLREREPVATLLALGRGDSGLIREARFYWD